MLEITDAITIEHVPQKTSIKVRGAEKPVGNREGEVHVFFHHQPGVVMGSVMAPQRIYKREVTNKPVLINVTAEMHELIDEISAGCSADEEPSDIACDDKIEYGDAR